MNQEFEILILSNNILLLNIGFLGCPSRAEGHQLRHGASIIPKSKGVVLFQEFFKFILKGCCC